jgi:hypothetical protein
VAIDVQAIKNVYRAELGNCEPILIRRYTGAGNNRPRFDVSVMAKVAGFQPNDLKDGIIQGDTRLIVLADDLIAAQFPLPLKKGDKAVVRGRELNIEAVDDHTRRVGIVLIAYQLSARGGG